MMRRAFALTPIFQARERNPRVLPATVETEAGQGDDIADFRLLLVIRLDLLDDRQRALLRRADRQLDCRDEIALVFFRQK